LQRVRITTQHDGGYDRIRSHEGAIHIPPSSLRGPMTANKRQALKGCYRPPVRRSTVAPIIMHSPNPGRWHARSVAVELAALD